MQIAIRASEIQKAELLQKSFSTSVIVKWLTNDANVPNGTDAFFDLTFNDTDINRNNFTEDTLVFANSVNCSCGEINKKNYVRLNAWPGFLNRSIIELAGCDDNYKRLATEVFDSLNWKFNWAPDDYGFIAARIIAMIINEAYYTLQENISTKEQIDIAMKLGTNYPYGPFEWSEKIGIGNIYLLLQKLSEKNKRYAIAELLKQASLEIN